MNRAVLEQPPLFDAVFGAHFVTVVPVSDRCVVQTAGRDEWHASTWYRWSCSCGLVPPAINRWSHAELAERMGVHHAEAAA